MHDIDLVLKEFIDFTNNQVGVYMDAIAGFENVRLITERQIHRSNRPSTAKLGKDRTPEITWVSYEDPSKPDIIHTRIIRTQDYIAINSPGGANEQQQARSTLVFLFTYWEDEIRPRLAAAMGASKVEVKADVMGDLRIIRNAILHSKSKISMDDFKRMKSLKGMFEAEKEIHISYENMHAIFVKIKQEIARLFLSGHKIENAPLDPDQLQGIAIQTKR